MGGLILMTILCGVMAWGIYRTVVNLVEMRQPTGTVKSLYLQPKGAYENGRRDMLYAVYNTIGAGHIMKLAIGVGQNPVTYLAELMYKFPDQWIEPYAKFSLNSGRTNKMYMTASVGKEFEQYIVGGRELIDDLDKELARLREQNEVVEARKEALADSDRFHNLSRKELKNLQQREARANSELEAFEKQMKEIENDTQND